MARRLILVGLILAAAINSRSAELLVSDCDVVEVIAEDPAQERLAIKIAGQVCERAKHLKRLFSQKRARKISIRICADMQSYRSRSGRKWFVAAVAFENEIVTQPARSLFKIRNLENLLAHELVHLHIKRVAGRNCPRWLDEGLAQWLAGQKAGLAETTEIKLPANEEELARLEQRLTSFASTREEMKSDYKICLRLVDKIIRSHSVEALLGALVQLKTAKEALSIKIDGKSLKIILFTGS
jgi:hypothetical protein